MTANLDRTREAFDAFLRRDPMVIGRLITDDTIWRVPGASSLAGEYRGRGEIFAFLRSTGELTDRTYRADLHFVVGDDENVVALYRATGRRGERTLDIPQLLIFNYSGDRWAEVTAVPIDQQAFDSFWA